MYDIAIIGAGPAGLSAGLFCGLYKLKTLIIGDVIGGQIIFAPMIFDYPGVESISGKDWLSGILEQVKKSGVELVNEKVTGVKKESSNQTSKFTLQTSQNNTFISASLIFATGNEKRRTNYSGVSLAKSLGIDVTNDGFIASRNTLETNVLGVFTAGNCLKFPDSLEQVVNAAAQGTQAAAMIYEFLKNEKAPILWGKASIPNR